MSAKSIQLSAIRIDGGTQSREALNQATVAEYAEAMTEGVTFPPITLFFDGSIHWLVDGFHRYFAAKQVGFTDMPAEVRVGTRLDAQWASYTVNKDHGLRRSNADKRKAVMGALAHPYGKAKSDNQIAKELGVHHSTVGDIRRSLADSASDVPAERTYTTKHGTTAVMNTANIGVQQHREAAKARHEADIARGGHGSESAPLPVAEPANDADTGQSIDELIAEIQKENEQLHAQLKAMEADDTKAELRKALLQRDHAIRQQSEAMDKAHKSQDREKWAKRQLMRCGKAVGEEDPDKIAAAVEAFIRQYRKAA